MRGIVRFLKLFFKRLRPNGRGIPPLVWGKIAIPFVFHLPLLNTKTAGSSKKKSEFKNILNSL
jgi:hypothetical protein